MVLAVVEVRLRLEATNNCLVKLILEVLLKCIMTKKYINLFTHVEMNCFYYYYYFIFLIGTFYIYPFYSNLFS